MEHIADMGTTPRKGRTNSIGSGYIVGRAHPIQRGRMQDGKFKNRFSKIPSN
jgi:hypothetical protein